MNRKSVKLALLFVLCLGAGLTFAPPPADSALLYPRCSWFCCTTLGSFFEPCTAPASSEVISCNVYMVSQPCSCESYCCNYGGPAGAPCKTLSGSTTSCGAYLASHYCP